MFAKPYKLKSNNTLKNSEKKYLAQRLQDEFPGATDENVKELVPMKSTSSCMKLILHSGDLVGVYVVDGLPMIIEDERGLVPTVCALWKVPDLVPTLIIHTPVLPKVLGGAPLYRPGVARGDWGAVARGGALAAAPADNRAAALVGRAPRAGADMRQQLAGVCLETIHVFGDLLCKENKFNKIIRPNMGPPSYPSEDIAALATDLNQLSMVSLVKEEWPSLGHARPAPAAPGPAAAADPAPNPAPAPHQPAVIPATPASAAPSPDAADDSLDADDSIVADESLSAGAGAEAGAGAPADMDGLLRWCVLSLLKLRGKQLELPLKTNLLYRNHLMPLCPSGRTLDVKKSTYKKMGKFLEAMQKEGLLEVRELEKGVDAVVAVNCAHPDVRRHVGAGPPPAAAPPAPAGDYRPPQVHEVFSLTAHVLDLFPDHKRGAVLAADALRGAVQRHVRARGLGRGAGVALDATLARLLARRETEEVPWEEVMAGVQGRCTASTRLQHADGSVTVLRSRLPPVGMQVASRAGNKKVTLVSNLESYGFNLQALSAACQSGAAAACSVTRTPGAKQDQLLLQGDQTYFMAKLLIEKYGLPKKYVEGADKALKKKK